MTKIINLETSIITDGLLFPEGPIYLNDGSILVVEIARGTLTQVFENGKKEIISNLGEGPNGAAIGPDGFCYICNNGGFEWEFSKDKKKRRPIAQAKNYKSGKIQKVNLTTGCFETLYSECNGISLKGPNDIVFDKKGNFWFTDLGKVRERTMDRGSVFWAKTDGSMIKEVIHPIMTPNGIGLSPDENFLYIADTEGGKVYSFEIIGDGKIRKIDFPNSIYGGKLLNENSGLFRFDSLAVEMSGNICVGTLYKGGVTVISPTSGFKEFYKLDDPYITNLCFGGVNNKTAFITASYEGLLLKADWPRQGLSCNFNI
ncbi:MAG: SMP-30/gluconolactonase/LRE family protein [Alphaproteobacteria bacterium]